MAYGRGKFNRLDREVTAMARRPAALRLLEAALDASYQASKAAALAWAAPPQ